MMKKVISTFMTIIMAFCLNVNLCSFAKNSDETGLFDYIVNNPSEICNHGEFNFYDSFKTIARKFIDSKRSWLENKAIEMEDDPIVSFFVNRLLPNFGVLGTAFKQVNRKTIEENNIMDLFFKFLKNTDYEKLCGPKS